LFFYFFYLNIFNIKVNDFVAMKKLLILLPLIILSSGCVNNMGIVNGDLVSLEYTGTLSDGTVFDSNVGGQALTFTAGAGQMIAGFDAAVIGMGIGEEKTFTLAPSEAYGERNEDYVQKLNATDLKNILGQEPIVGMVLTAGNGASGKIISIADGIVSIDFNHELAGKALTFKIKILDVKKN
jgi:peptidylprolyl isomerase